MNRFGVFLLLSSLAALPGAAGAAGHLRFWNLTSVTITQLYLAPAGTSDWGPEQCRNDPDKSVSVDERLNLTAVSAGRYDVKLTDQKRRTCLVRNVEVKDSGPYAFSLADEDLAECH
jgi:hypothetical protein